MTDETIRHLMADLKLKGMLAEYESWASDGMAQMTFHVKLGLLLQAQHDLKRDNKVRAMHNKAKLAQPDAYTEEIIYDADRGLDRDLIVELAGCSFVADSDNVLVLGASDCGKSYVGCALGNAACRHGINTRYTRLSDLFEELEIAETKGRYLAKFNEFAKAKVLILDDFLVSIPKVTQVQILLELLERREYTGSTIICSLLHPSQWQQRINEKIQANSIYARLVPGAHWVEIKGEQPMRERVRSRR